MGAGYAGYSNKEENREPYSYTDAGTVYSFSYGLNMFLVSSPNKFGSVGFIN